jgi:hypothetical protein
MSNKHLKTRVSRKVILHVYDLREGVEYNEKLFCIGLGAFHTGLEIVGEGIHHIILLIKP